MNYTFNALGDLIITPSSTSSPRDFGFYLGRWKIKNRKLKEKFKNCEEWVVFDATDETTSLLLGWANKNTFVSEIDGKPFEGMAIRLFDPNTKLWSIYWADSNNVVFDPPMVGSFDGNIGKFYCLDTFQGRDILVLFHWDKTDIDNPVWSQAFSDDKGKTWEWNWFMHASRL